MTQDSRICQNCKSTFTIEPDDFAFYEKIKVPPPTFCPKCRMMHKLIWSNEGALFRVKCQAPGHSEELISRYPSERGLKIYDSDYWWSDAWDPTEYGLDYDFSKPFFEQFLKLLNSVPLANVRSINSINCDYCTWASNSKNCYLVSGAYLSEDCMYSDTPAVSRKCIDVSILIFCENMYESCSCTRCFNLLFSEQCNECLDSKFLYDCRNCSNCFGCVGLRNKQYHIFNQPYSKKEYEKKMSELNLGSHKTLKDAKKEFEKLKSKIPRKYMAEKNTVGCTGNDIENAKNCQHSFEVRDGAENSKYLLICGRRIKDSYDVFAGGEKCELIYASSAFNSQNIRFTNGARESLDLQYCDTCQSCEHLFGCVGLRKKKYCILNKQYTKEEYEKIVPKIIEQMKQTPYINELGHIYKYGEFFPPEFSTCAYNNSLAQRYFPITKEKAQKQKLWWRDAELKTYANTINPEDLPDNIKNTDDKILEKIINCSHRGDCAHQCKRAFKIVPKELEFYRMINVALPRLCPECRRHIRNNGRERYNLSEKFCMCGGRTSENSTGEIIYENRTAHLHGETKCQNKFMTSYSNNDPEIIYCSECYQGEIQ